MPFRVLAAALSAVSPLPAGAAVTMLGGGPPGSVVEAIADAVPGALPPGQPVVVEKPAPGADPLDALERKQAAAALLHGDTFRNAARRSPAIADLEYFPLRRACFVLLVPMEAGGRRIRPAGRRRRGHRHRRRRIAHRRQLGGAFGRPPAARVGQDRVARRHARGRAPAQPTGFGGPALQPGDRAGRRRHQRRDRRSGPDRPAERRSALAVGRRRRSRLPAPPGDRRGHQGRRLRRSPMRRSAPIWASRFPMPRRPASPKPSRPPRTRNACRALPGR